MLISGRITSGVPNKGSTQLIFGGVDLSMLHAKEVVTTYCRECIGSRLRKNMSLTTADGEFLAAVTSALEREITTL